MRKTKVETDQSQDEKAILTFLKKTQEGKYAKIEKSSLQYARINEQTIVVTDQYYYGIR